jgi:hypothetical protein
MLPHPPNMWNYGTVFKTIFAMVTNGW